MSPRRRERRLAPLIAALPLLSFAGGAEAGGLQLPGDGSAANNPRLLADDCNCGLTGTPYEFGPDPFDLDWSVSLRGAYSGDSQAGASYEVQLAPEFSLTRLAVGSQMAVSGGAEIDMDGYGQKRIGALRLGFAEDLQWDEWTAWSVHSDVALTQSAPNATGLPANTASAPLHFSGTADASVTRQFGRLEASLRGNLGRVSSGSTVLDDASEVDNSADNNWKLGAGARLGYQLTPILTAFIDGSASYQKYDVISPSLLAYLDGWDYAAKTGLSAKWNEVLSGEASIGYGYRDYVDASLTDAGSWLYNASVTFKPDETLSLTGNLSTTIGPAATAPYATEVDYAASGNMAYLVNPLLSLRGSVGWNYAQDVASLVSTSGYDLGAGFDFRLAQQLLLTGDYGFAETRKSSDPIATQVHSVALGIKVTR